MVVVVIQSLSRIRLFATPKNAAHQVPLSFTTSRSLLRFTSIQSEMPSNHFILCRPLLLPSIFPSIKIFSSESGLRITWPNYWSISFSISPSNEYAGLISFWVDWFDLRAVEGTLESPPAPQFKRINSLALSLLYGPTLTSIHDYWKNLGFWW